MPDVRAVTESHQGIKAEVVIAAVCSEACAQITCGPEGAITRGSKQVPVAHGGGAPKFGPKQRILPMARW